MSAEFGENFKPSTGADVGKEEAAEKHDPFRDERALKAPDNTARADEKAEAKVAASELQVPHDKASFEEGKGKEYSDWLAENRTPQENAAALEKSLMAAVHKMAILTQAGMADVIPGGTFLAGLVKDGTPEEVHKFMATVRNYLEK